MSTYELIIATIAAINMVSTFMVMASNRSKAAAAKVAELGDELKQELASMEAHFNQRLTEQAVRIERLDTQAERAPKHEDLSAIYNQLNATRQQVERLTGEVSGQMEQMNANLRMVLTQLMKTL